MRVSTLQDLSPAMDVGVLCRPHTGLSGSPVASQQHGSGFGSGILLPNGCLQQIAANRFSTPQDVIAILLQGFVRHAWLFMNVCPVAHPLKPATIRMTRIILVR
jgi:hypothetical protein